MNKVHDILWMRYNFNLCDFKSLLVIKKFRTFYYSMEVSCVLCIMLIFAFLLCGNVGLGFLFSL